MASLTGRNRIDTDALKLAYPIGDVVARYGVELKRQGRAMVGRCIFHPDGGRPNLYIYAYVIWNQGLGRGAAAVVVISGEEGRGEEPLSVNNVENGGYCGKDRTRRAVAGDRLM